MTEYFYANSCAAFTCQGSAGKQRKLHSVEVANITGSALKLIQQHPQAVMFCTACMAVYLNDPQKRLLGFLEEFTFYGENWFMTGQC